MKLPELSAPEAQRLIVAALACAILADRQVWIEHLDELDIPQDWRELAIRRNDAILAMVVAAGERRRRRLVN